MKRYKYPAPPLRKTRKPAPHPRMYDDSQPAIRKLREVCLRLEGVVEKEAWGECTFRAVGGSMFAMTDNNHHDSGHVAVWIKAPAMVQEILIHSDPERFFKPPYVGAKGWVGVRLDTKVNWDEVATLLKDGYQLSIPKKRRTGTASGSKVPAAPGRRRRSIKP